MAYNRPTLARLRTLRRAFSRTLRSDAFNCMMSVNRGMATMDRDFIRDSIRRLDDVMGRFSTATWLEKEQALTFAMNDFRAFNERAQRLGCMAR